LTLAELENYLMVAFLAIFSFLGIFTIIFLIFILRTIKKIKVELDTANEKIGSFKESLNVINKSVDLFRSIFGNSKTNKE
tara:strand:- start:1007 stop:1246 length:240 start_codon:yes stop_codon:yes gene_type:complete